RVMALWMVGFAGSRPLASAVEGFLADAVSLPAALLVTAGVLLTVLCLFRPRRLDFPAARAGTLPEREVSRGGCPTDHDGRRASAPRRGPAGGGPPARGPALRAAAQR